MQQNRKHQSIRTIGYLSLIITILFLIGMLACAFMSAGRLDIYLPEGSRAADYRPEKDIVEISLDPDDEQHMIVHAKGRGRVFLDDESEYGGFEYVSILPGGIIFDESNGNFSGWKQIADAAVFYVFLITALLVISFILRCRSELFSYNTLFYGGLAMFFFSISLDLLLSFLIIRWSRTQYTMMHIYNIVKNAGTAFISFSLPIMAVFTLALIVSNISLIRHERRCLSNLLGVLLSGMIVLGYAGAFWIQNWFSSGSEQEMRIYNSVSSIYSTAFVYFQAMLLSASLCAVIAAKRKPKTAKTHVIILGCAIAADGTPLPLLRGRIDCAIAFAKMQKAEKGRDIIFVPSGGKGSDEVIAEAECMKNYLLSQGIGEEQILTEAESTNTRENMRFSLKKITASCDAPEIVFSTSGYHVLRSGIISRNAGLDAEGIGSKTKWYFFPNAFIREFIGLLVSKWKQHMILIAMFMILFAALNLIMPM